VKHNHHRAEHDRPGDATFWVSAERHNYVHKVHDHVCGLADHTHVESEILAVGFAHTGRCVQFVVDKVVGGRDENVPGQEDGNAEQQEHDVD